MSDDAPVTVLCNGATGSKEGSLRESKTLSLNYRNHDGSLPNVTIGLPNFCPQCLSFARTAS